jgi:hypothetical protein
MTEHQECYGKLFPSIENAECNVTHKGKVFRFRAERSGMLVSKRVTGVDAKQWEECTQCPDFNNATCFPCQAALNRPFEVTRSVSAEDQRRVACRAL